MAEAASFVLAALPLIIEGLRAYAEGIVTIKKWWRYRTLLQHIVRRLEVEQVKLYNTCTNLLQDLVDDDTLHLLLENPGGFRWREDSLRTSLKLRLGKSFHVFLNTMNDMKEVVELLKARLDLDTDNKVSRYKHAIERPHSDGVNHSPDGRIMRPTSMSGKGYDSCCRKKPSRPSLSVSVKIIRISLIC